ncbi:hypothetical protein D3C72_2015460 [compost metagenome]
MSGMQVKPLLPWRRVRILPSASMATTVAAALTFFGAALIALLIICVSLAAITAGTWPMTASAMAMVRQRCVKVDVDMITPSCNATGVYPAAASAADDTWRV